MGRVWGSMIIDYITKREDVCARCNQQKFECKCFGGLCEADCDIKRDYKHGRTQAAIDMLRSLPTEALKDYLPEERRTPTELVAVILDELQKRNEAENSMRL